MKDLRYRSVFDIIGPVMIGPSSSHTAGAARIGKIIRSIFGEQPDSVDIYLYESFAKPIGARNRYCISWRPVRDGTR